MCLDAFTHGHRFSGGVVAYTILFLLYLRLRSVYIKDHRHIVSINISGTINRYTHHAELIAELTQIFNSMRHGNKLRPKNSLLNSGLFLGDPVNECHVDIDHIAREVSTISLIPPVVTIYHHS